MREFQKTLLVSGFCVLMAANANGEPGGGVSGLQDLMTPEQYRSAGLHKLGDQERAALYQWLRLQGVEPEMPAKVILTELPSAAAPVADAPTVQAVPVSPAAAPAAPAAATVATVPVAAEPVIKPGEKPSAAVVDENFGLPEPREASPEERYQLHATVKEPFKGWSGKTVFYLDNGQVWRQRASGRYTYMGGDNRVVISKNSWGFFEMRLVEADRSVGVKRVK